MAYEPFEPALPIPVNFSVQDNKYEGKEKYQKKLRLFVPLESAPDFVSHVMNMVEQKKYHKTGKVYDMRTGDKSKLKVFISMATERSVLSTQTNMVLMAL